MDHVSPTQLSMFVRCPRQYAFRYVENLRRPPGIAMLVGGGLHKGAEYGMRGKLLTGQNQPANEIRDAAVGGFDERIAAEDVMLKEDEQSQGRPAVVARARDRVAAFAHFWGCVCQPDYMPERIEEKFAVPLREDLELVGVVDLLSVSRKIIDWKTATKAPSQHDADVSLQLTSYSLWYEHEFRQQPAGVCLDVLVERTASTDRLVLASSRTRMDYRALLARIEALELAKQAGSFPPCSPDNWWCSKRFCGYFPECPYV